MGTYSEKNRWTEKQKMFVENNYDKYTDDQLAEMLGRSRKSVRRKRQRLMLRKACGRGICAKYDSSKESVKITTVIENKDQQV